MSISRVGEQMKKITLFILNYNGIKEINEGSLRTISEAANNIQDVEISVVYLDNFSNDGSIELVDSYFDKVIVASTFKNEGYARGTNIGIELGWKVFKPDYFLLVDSDNFCEKDAYKKLYEFMETNTDIGMAQPRVMSYKNKDELVSCGHSFRESGGTISVKKMNEEMDLLNLRSCSISSTIIRTEALLETGLLNEVFEMYYESSDLSFRIRESGYRCACCWDAVCYNERLESDSFRNFNKFYLMRRNLFLFWYLHDLTEYKRVCKWWKEEYETRQSFYENDEYIVDYKNEMERRAIEEGMNLADSKLVMNQIPRIDQFDKKSVYIYRKKGI